MYKRFVIAATTIAALGGTAWAADMPMYSVKRRLHRMGYDWSGAYIGGHVGGGWSTTTFADPGGQSILNNCCVAISAVNNPGAATNGSGPSGFLGGVQAGFMYQIDVWWWALISTGPQPV